MKNTYVKNSSYISRKKSAFGAKFFKTYYISSTKGDIDINEKNII